MQAHGRLPQRVWQLEREREREVAAKGQRAPHHAWLGLRQWWPPSVAWQRLQLRAGGMGALAAA